jgi:hypothetical protein
VPVPVPAPPSAMLAADVWQSSSSPAAAGGGEAGGSGGAGDSVAWQEPDPSGTASTAGTSAGSRMVLLRPSLHTKTRVWTRPPSAPAPFYAYASSSPTSYTSSPPTQAFASPFVGRPPAVTIDGVPSEIGAACSRLVVELSKLATHIGNSSGWPLVSVPVRFGGSLVQMPMTVLEGSVAANMKDVQLGGRLAAACRGVIKLDRRAVHSLCYKMAQPAEAQASAGGATSARGFSSGSGCPRGEGGTSLVGTPRQRPRSARPPSSMLLTRGGWPRSAAWGVASATVDSPSTPSSDTDRGSNTPSCTCSDAGSELEDDTDEQ